MKTGRDEKDLLKQLDEFFTRKVPKRLRSGYEEIERMLKKEIRFGNGGDPLVYDPDNPFCYLAAFVRDKGVATVAPSTKYLVNRVLRAMHLDAARVVVEYGPANGVMTRRILARLPHDAVLVAVERNEHFCRGLRRLHDPRLRLVQGDAQEIDRIMRGHDLPHADVIVSGIPFSYFDKDERDRLVAKTHAWLAPGGRFVAYQCTTHLIPVLKRHFRRVETQFELRNLPPHFVFAAFK